MTIDKRAIAEDLKRLDFSNSDNPKAWAWRLRAREAAGDRLTKAQRDMWRSALRVEMATAEAEV